MDKDKPWKIGVLGAGAFGMALALELHSQGHQLTIWHYKPEEVANMQVNRRSQALAGISLPPSLDLTHDIMQACQDKEAILIVVPSVHIRSLVLQIDWEKLETTPYIVVLSKGFLDPIEPSTLPELATAFLKLSLPSQFQEKILYIAGPSHAEELAHQCLMGLMVTGENLHQASIFAKAIRSSVIKPFVSQDWIGIQVASVAKNVIALAFGIVDGLKEKGALPFFHDNAFALLFALGLREIQILGEALGSLDTQTYCFLAGSGDLDVTCHSIHGRNRRFGREIVLQNILEPFMNLQDLLKKTASLPYLVEGIAGTETTRKFASHYGLEVPLITLVYDILNKSVEPEKAFSQFIEKL